MTAGSCLCGAIRFEIDGFVGPFELCHCPRCRRASGSAFVSGVGARARDFRWISGEDEVRLFELPVRERPPGYQSAFCPTCGSPAPNLAGVTEEDDWIEIAAGTLDGELGLAPDRHIFVECGSTWYEIADSLPQSTGAEVVEMRMAEWKEKRGRWSRS